MEWIKIGRGPKKDTCSRNRLMRSNEKLVQQEQKEENRFLCHCRSRSRRIWQLVRCGTEQKAQAKMSLGFCTWVTGRRLLLLAEIRNSEGCIVWGRKEDNGFNSCWSQCTEISHVKLKSVEHGLDFEGQNWIWVNRKWRFGHSRPKEQHVWKLMSVNI